MNKIISLLIEQAVRDAACRSDKDENFVVVNVKHVSEEFFKNPRTKFYVNPDSSSDFTSRREYVNGIRKDIHDLIQKYDLDVWLFDESERETVVFKTLHFNKDLIDELQGLVNPFRLKWQRIGESHESVH